MVICVIEMSQHNSQPNLRTDSAIGAILQTRKILGHHSSCRPTTILFQLNILLIIDLYIL